MSVTLAHIVNPYKAPAGSDAGRIQQLSLQALLNARRYSGSEAQVQLYTTQYTDDRAVIPEGFTVLPDLERSVLDVHSFESAQLKLPLIQDILRSLYHHSPAEYLIFTNVDIIPLPFFYDAVAAYLQQGHDALIINRRRISNTFLKDKSLAEIYAATGHPHPGFDCFVIKRELIPKLVLGHICVGIPFIGVSLAHNIFAFSNNYKLITDAHLTTHIGLEVLPERNKEYYWFNRKQFNDIYRKIKPHIKKDQLPYAALPWYRRWLKWALNPSTFTLPYITTDMSDKRSLPKKVAEELRFWMLSW